MNALPVCESFDWYVTWWNKCNWWITTGLIVSSNKRCRKIHGWNFPPPQTQRGRIFIKSTIIAIKFDMIRDWGPFILISTYNKFDFIVSLDFLWVVIVAFMICRANFNSVTVTKDLWQQITLPNLKAVSHACCNSLWRRSLFDWASAIRATKATTKFPFPAPTKKMKNPQLRTAYQHLEVRMQRYVYGCRSGDLHRHSDLKADASETKEMCECRCTSTRIYKQ